MTELEGGSPEELIATPAPRLGEATRRTIAVHAVLGG